MGRSRRDQAHSLAGLVTKRPQPCRLTPVGLPLPGPSLFKHLPQATSHTRIVGPLSLRRQPFEPVGQPPNVSRGLQMSRPWGPRRRLAVDGLRRLWVLCRRNQTTQETNVVPSPLGPGLHYGMNASCCRPSQASLTFQGCHGARNKTIYLDMQRCIKRSDYPPQAIEYCKQPSSPSFSSSFLVLTCLIRSLNTCCCCFIFRNILSIYLLT